MKDFIYNADEHIGTYKGRVVPSITQLLALEYPIGDISQSVLERASEKGTMVHSDIELFNKGLKEHCETEEGHNYELLMKNFNFVPYETEQQVFILDDDGEVITYGTLDLIAKFLENSFIFEKETLALCDIKTVSQFYNEKVAWQTNMYRLAYKQTFGKEIGALFGIWLRENEKDHICQLRPLDMLDDKQVYEKVVSLANRWQECQHE